jgi:hypothetical protein
MQEAEIQRIVVPDYLKQKKFSKPYLNWEKSGYFSPQLWWGA